MSTEQDPFNNETNQKQEKQALAELEFEVASGLEDIILGAYTPAQLDDIIIGSLQNNQSEFRLQTVVSDSANYWLLSVTHRNRSPHQENRSPSVGTFYKVVSAELLADIPAGHGVTGQRYVLTFQVGALPAEKTDLYATEGYSTEQTGSPRVVYDNTLITEVGSAKKLCDRLERVLRNGDNPDVYVFGKKADRLIKRHNDYFNL